MIALIIITAFISIASIFIGCELGELIANRKTKQPLREGTGQWQAVGTLPQPMRGQHRAGLSVPEGRPEGIRGMLSHKANQTLGFWVGVYLKPRVVEASLLVIP